MANIKPGRYAVAEIFRIAGFDLASKAAVDYGDGIDRRLVKIGGLSFDNLEEEVVIPSTTDEVEITVGGQLDTVLSVVLGKVHQAERAASFASAIDSPSYTGFEE